ncbi:MAG: T9SS type A sorting domain-containing protein, partial [Candidatus Eisenbacteria bacterium]|nr:T9SS type A sorting domain-containing protein [Candidatus Eisenbacteria bacterium]
PLRGFEVWRSALESNGEGAAPIKVHEGLLAAAARSFEDRELDPLRACRYELRARGPLGKERRLGEARYEGPGEGGAMLRLVGPNPSLQGTAVLFRTPVAGPGELAVYDATGRRVRTLFAQPQGGPHSGSVAWDGRDAAGRPVASGLYWIRLTAPQLKRTARLVVVR